MTLFAVLNPDGTPLCARESMRAAQEAIEAVEPDILKQNAYQIHPISGPADAERLKLKVHVHWKLEKFEGEYAGQEPFEVLEGNFDGTH